MEAIGKKIFVATWREGKNWGDDYLSLSLRKFLSRKFLSSSVIETNLHLDDYNLTKKDILIIGGGGLWGPGGTGKLEHRLYSIWMKTPAKLVIANIGIGSFEPSSRQQLIDLCGKAEVFYLRDEMSWSLAQKVVGEDKVFWGADNSYLSPIQIERRPIKKCIGVNLCNSERDNYQKSYSVDLVVKSISKLPKWGYDLKAVVFAYKDELSDYKYCKQIDPTCSRRFSFTGYRTCEIFIGTHFHSIVLALQNGIPVIAINHSDKVSRVMQEYGLGEYRLDSEDPILFDKMISRIRTMDKDIFLKKIREGNENAQQRLVPFENKLRLIIENCQ